MNITTSRLGELVEADYRAAGRKSAHSIPPRRRHLERLIENPLNPSEIEAYKVRRREEGAAAATVKNELIVLRRGLRLAYERREIDWLPVVRYPRIANTRTESLSVEEIRKLLRGLEVLDRPVSHLVRWYVLTGWRRSEPLAMRWGEHVSALRDRVSLPDSKTGVREIHVSGGLREVLEARWLERSGPWVWHRRGAPIRTFKGSWQRMARALDRPDLRVHDLRRSFAQLCSDRGVSEHVAMKIAGWQSPSTWRRYAIVSRPAQEAAHRAITSALGSGRERTW